MNPDGTHAEIIGHGYRNSYEQVVNSLGDMYQSDNDDYSSCRNSYVLEFGSAGYILWTVSISGRLTKTWSGNPKSSLATG